MARLRSVRLLLVLAGCVAVWFLILPQEIRRFSAPVGVSDAAQVPDRWGAGTVGVLLLSAPLPVLAQLLLITSLGYFVSLCVGLDLSFGVLWEALQTCSLARSQGQTVCRQGELMSPQGSHGDCGQRSSMH